jgi:hypothetical protein
VDLSTGRQAGSPLVARGVLNRRRRHGPRVWREGQWREDRRRASRELDLFSCDTLAGVDDRTRVLLTGR